MALLSLRKSVNDPSRNKQMLISRKWPFVSLPQQVKVSALAATVGRAERVAAAGRPYLVGRSHLVGARLAPDTTRAIRSRQWRAEQAQ